MMDTGFSGRIWASALTGIPFGIYKFGFGWYECHHGHSIIGVAAMIWGSIDILINIAAVPLTGRLSWCLLSNIGRLVDTARRKKSWENILLAIDTTASFLIVSVMIWFGRLPLEPPIMATIWNLAVVSNVLAVGLNQFYQAVTDR